MDYARSHIKNTDVELDVSKVTRVTDLITRHSSALTIETSQQIPYSTEFVIEGPDVIWELLYTWQGGHNYKLIVKDVDLFLVLKLMI